MDGKCATCGGAAQDKCHGQCARVFTSFSADHHRTQPSFCAAGACQQLCQSLKLLMARLKHPPPRARIHTQAVKEKHSFKDLALTYNKTFSLRYAPATAQKGSTAVVEVSLCDASSSGLEYVGAASCLLPLIQLREAEYLFFGGNASLCSHPSNVSMLEWQRKRSKGIQRIIIT